MSSKKGNGLDDEDGGPPRPVPRQQYPELTLGLANLSSSLNGLSTRVLQAMQHVARGRLGDAALDDLGDEVHSSARKMDAVAALLKAPR